jgi:hypothetical protein
MELVNATDEDNERLLHYFAQMTMPGPIDIRSRRMFNFFNQYRIQTEDYVTCLLENEKKEIEAMASILFRPGKIDGVDEMIGYATDLRVSPTRRAILNWSQHFLPVLEAERESRNCRYIFSAVPHSQRQAYNAFIRPRNLRRRMPRYHLFRRLELVSIHGLWPFHDLPLSGIKVRTASEQIFFSTINRNPKSFLFAIVGAEYLLRLLPTGTHQYEKFIRPSELEAWARSAGLVHRGSTGMHYNPLSRIYSLGQNVDVNYLMHFVRPEEA